MFVRLILQHRACSKLAPVNSDQSAAEQPDLIAAAWATLRHFLDTALQIFGAMGVSQDTPMPQMWALARIMRIADGPDAVHMSQLAKLTIRQLCTPTPG